MINPSKYEDLNFNIIILGARIINILSKKPHNLEKLYAKLYAKIRVDVDLYLDTITFLWLTGCIDYSYYVIKLIAPAPAVAGDENKEGI
jgi:hypothetical protein